MVVYLSTKGQVFGLTSCGNCFRSLSFLPVALSSLSERGLTKRLPKSAVFGPSSCGVLSIFVRQGFEWSSGWANPNLLHFPYGLFGFLLVAYVARYGLDAERPGANDPQPFPRTPRIAAVRRWRGGYGQGLKGAAWPRGGFCRSPGVGSAFLFLLLVIGCACEEEQEPRVTPNGQLEGS